MLELRHLKAMLALFETGSVTLAATRLHLTQSALSHQLASLENYLETPLFERQQRPLKLTPAGELLLQLAQKVLPEFEKTRQAIAQLKTLGVVRELRIAVECHTCYDWLMPAMDNYREQQNAVELDLVAGFHTDPLLLLAEQQADVVIVSEAKAQRNITYFPLFSYEIVALIARQHAFVEKAYLVAEDFATVTLITYPVPDAKLDLIQHVLKPAGINPTRRTAELTIAILQLVASRRGIAALPRWAVQPYLERDYVQARPIGIQGLWGELYAAVRSHEKDIHVGFITTLIETAFATLKDLKNKRLPE
ncbi:transcriptional regulator [Beggiatoa alba B18LD]|uniref:HTH-type transcriptional regulator MetR n=1 Tax=Beggiatoa alba B18LD TaxID=395493 RepID=I3CDW4_9GAMM|nr:LysR family transcriptional regulator [Beggiatoa alba]EIJ41807.1 transcriptional regulator [Beggiatoa alba B18LD]